MSTSASITSPIGACWLTKNTPGLTPPLVRNAPLRHCLAIMGDQDAILLCSEREDIRVRNSLKPRFVSRKEIHCRFAASTTFDNCVVEIGVRQIADHGSDSPCRLPPHTPELLFDIGSVGVSCGIRILCTPALFDCALDFFLVVLIKGNGPTDLLQVQCWIMRPDCLRIFTVAVFRDNAVNGNTAPNDVKSGITALDVFAGHGNAFFQCIHCRAADAGKTASNNH